MRGFRPGVLDRLMDERPMNERRDAEGGALTIDAIKDLVARDLEALLNSRVALPPAAFASHPLAAASILNYGLLDFAAFCLTGAEDRAAICASIKSAIEVHEPRLKDVNASLVPVQGSVNRLDFVIHARLALPDVRNMDNAEGNVEGKTAGKTVGDAAGAAVNFSAVLQPSSLHYAVRRTARPRT